jgi:cytochrome oxidase Cu insertion factor (SCO1/SenC/PrrC family)
MNRRDLLTCHVADKSRPAASLGPRYYTNALLRTHENKQVRFYDDLIKGKISIINFMYASCDKLCPRSIDCLAKVQDLLGDHLGRDMFMYSFTLKPDRTPRNARRLCQAHRGKKRLVLPQRQRV